MKWGQNMKIRKRMFSLIILSVFVFILVACSNIKTFNVTFEDYDGTVLKVEAVELEKAATAPNNPTREGHTFEGWDIDFSNIKEDLTVKATYSINKYTVVFKDHDSTNLKVEEVEFGSFATAPNIPAREGYTFEGWDIDFSNIKEDLTVTATYNINKYTVIFRDHKGSNLKEQEVEFSSFATAPNVPAREGYTFVSWDTNFTNVKNNLIVTATYKLNEYTLTFKGLENEVLKTEKVNHGTTYHVVYNPSLNGYIFVGWYFDAEFNEEVDGPISVTQGLELFSKWDKNEYKATYITNSDEIIDDELYLYNDIVTNFPILSKEDYYFEGWFLDESFTSKVGASHKITSNTEFHAKWILLTDKLFTVTFKDWNGNILSTVQVYGKSDAEFDINSLRREHSDWKYYYEFSTWDKPVTHVVSDLEVNAEYQLKYNKVIKTTSSYVLRENGDLYQVFTNKQQNHIKIEFDVVDIAESKGTALDTKPKHLLVVKKDGRLLAMGSNDLGQLGDGTNIDRKDLTLIGEDFIKVYTYYKSSYGIKSDGSLFSWGNNQYSQLGLGHSRNIYIPTDTEHNFIDIAVNETGVLGLTVLGDIYSWGRNWQGSLGSGVVDSTNSTPVFVDSGYKSISFGGFNYLTAYGIKFNGDVYNWGSNLNGDFGNGRSAYNKDSSVDLQNYITLTPTKSLTAYHMIYSNNLTVGISLTGQLYSWGYYTSLPLTNFITGTLEGETTREPALVAPLATEIFNIGFNWFFYGIDGNLYGFGNDVSYFYDGGTTIMNYVPILIENSSVQ